MQNQHSSLDVTLNFPSSSKGTLLLEQMEYTEYVGKLTKAGAVYGLLSFMFPDTSPATDAYCGGVDDQFDTVVFVYKWDESIDYTLHTSQSEGLGLRVTESLVYRETLSFNFTKTADFKYPADYQLEDFAWEGPAYDEDGNVVDYPEVILSREDVTLSKTCYCALTVVYSVTRDKYTCRIGKSTSNYYSVAYAIWNEGIEIIELSIPNGFDVTGGNCNNGSSSFKLKKNPEGAPTVQGEDQVVRVDYCTQEIL